MKKTILKIFALSAAFSLICCSSFAKIEFVPENGVYSLKGTDEIHQGNMLSVEILNGTDVYHASYIVPDKNGNFNYSFSLGEDAPSVEYSIKVSSTSRELSVLPNKFSHATPFKKGEIILLLENATDRSSAKTAFLEAVKYAMISYPENSMASYPSSWNDKMKNMVYDQIKDYNGFTLDNYSKVISEMYAVSALANATGTNVNDVIEIYKNDLAFESMTSYYNTYIISNQSDINALFLDNTFTNIEELRKVFKQIVIINSINNQNAPAKIVSLINNNKDILPQEVTDLDDEKKLTLAGKIIDALEKGTKLKCASDLTSYIPTSSVQRPGGATTSSGGSSSGGSKISFVPSVSDTNLHNTNTNLISFADINNASWAREAIENLVRKGIIKGYDDGDFKPNNFVTREEFVKIIVMAFDLKLSDLDAGFSDVSKDFWAYKYINCAKENSVVNGISDKKFGIGLNITRQDMAVIISNALSLKGKDIQKSDMIFADDDSISAYAKDAVYKLKNANIIKGYDDNTFKPFANATRAEAAQMIYNVLKMLG